jgi:hypothetical protein
MNEKTVCIECGKRESDEHIGHAYRPAIWPLSGGEVSGVRVEKSEVSDNRSPPTQLQHQLREIAEKYRTDFIENCPEFPNGYWKSLDDIILRAMQEAYELGARHNQIPIPPTEKELSIEAQCNE